MTAEQIAFIVLLGIVVFPLFIISITLLKGKGAFLIAGYNTMSKEKQNKIKEKELCKFLGLMILFILVFIIVFAVGAVLENRTLIIVGGSLFAAIVLFTIIFANSKKFKKKAD